MVSRRNFLLSAAGASVSALSGCPYVSGADGSLQEVGIIIYNRDTASRTFEFALEVEDRILDWESQTVETDSDGVVYIDPPEDSYPVAIRGKTGEYEERYEFDDLGYPDDDYCLYLYFHYQHQFWGNRITRARSLECG